MRASVRAPLNAAEEKNVMTLLDVADEKSATLFDDDSSSSTWPGRRGLAASAGDAADDLLIRKTLLGGRDCFSTPRAGSLFSLVAGPHGVIGLDSPDLADAPTIGRFVQKDPRDPVLEQYIYTRNRPLLGTDPTGQWPEWLDELLRAFGPRSGPGGDPRARMGHLRAAAEHIRPVAEAVESFNKQVTEPIAEGAGEALMFIPYAFYDAGYVIYVFEGGGWSDEDLKNPISRAFISRVNSGQSPGEAVARTSGDVATLGLVTRGANTYEGFVDVTEGRMTEAEYRASLFRYTGGDVVALAGAKVLPGGNEPILLRARPRAVTIGNPSEFNSLIDAMNKRQGVRAEVATGDMARYLEAQRASGVTRATEGGYEMSFHRGTAGRWTAFHEWLHRSLTERGVPVQAQDAIIESFLERHKSFLKIQPDPFPVPKPSTEGPTSP